MSDWLKVDETKSSSSWADAEQNFLRTVENKDSISSTMLSKYE